MHACSRILTILSRMEADVEHFRAKLGKIDGAGNLGDKLLELVQAKPIIKPLFEAGDSEPTSVTQSQDTGSESAES